MTLATWWAWFIPAVLVGFAIPEFLAIRNKVPGDTLSEKTRQWFKTSTPGGGTTFAVLWVVLLAVWVWFLPHILGG